MAAKKATVKPVVKPAAKSAETAVKVEAPKTENVKAENKATTQEAPAKSEEKKAEPAAAKKATAKKTAAKKETVKKAPAKRAAKAELKTEFHVQFSGKSLSQEELMKMAKDVWKYDLKQKVGDLTSVVLYVKPEEGKTYYVMNKDFTGSFEI